MANEAARLLFTRRQPLFTEHQKPCLLVRHSLGRRRMKSLHFIPLVKRSACAAREVAACRRVDVFLIKSAPAVLKRRQAALIFPFAVIYLFP